MDSCDVIYLPVAAARGKDQKKPIAYSAMVTDGVMYLPREASDARIYDFQSWALARQNRPR